MQKTLRFRDFSPARRTAIPPGWSTTSSAPAEDQNALFERAANLRYDGNDAVWDQLLEILNFSLSLQPAVAKVLSQDGWRNAKDPKAYIATAAWRQHLSMNLADFESRQFRVERAETGEVHHDIDHRPDIAVDQNGNDRTISDLERLDNQMYRSDMQNGAYDVDVPPRVPAWLQMPDEPDHVDWMLVAKHAALKSAMVPALARTLELRFGQGLTRDAAVRRTKGHAQRRCIETAWRWIDRNLETRISRVLCMEQPPQPIPIVKAGTRKVAFIPPAEALRRIAARQQDPAGYVHAPSLTQSAPSFILPADTHLVWGRGGCGATATLWDNKTHMFLLRVEGEDRNEVLQQLNAIFREWSAWQQYFADELCLRLPDATTLE